MYTDRQTILSLVAYGRITAAEAERLIAACSGYREAWLALACCALGVGLIQPLALMRFQLHAFSLIVHLIRPFIVGANPALDHVLSTIALLWGGI